MSIVQRGKTFVRNCAAVPILMGLWRPVLSRQAVLNYHRVTREPIGSDVFDPNRALSVTAAAFDEQLRFLRRHGKFVTLDEVVDVYGCNDEWRKGGTAITFDDGYRDNYSVALPIAEKYEAPIAIFVTSGFIDRTADLWWEEQTFIINRTEQIRVNIAGTPREWTTRLRKEKEQASGDLRTFFKGLDVPSQRTAMEQLRSQCSERYSYESEMMSWEELQAMAKHPLVTLGVHTVNHAVLSRLSPEEVARELTESRDRLTQMIGVPFDYLAYPMGQREYASYREFSIARRCGFKAAFASGPSEPLEDGKERVYHIPRIPVDYEDTILPFVWKASGL
jgi:peptidoglycan/xylan/chitin deacetylase (PgdA/CDA1 family)